MNILIGTIFLGVAALWLWQKLPGPEARSQARADATRLGWFIFPRITIALIGAALFAELLPPELVRDMFGSDAGALGILLAVLIGPITPGGAFVCFAIAAAGLQVGAAEAAVAAYVTSWALFSVTKTLAYEMPMLGMHMTLGRVVLSLPIPFLVGFAVLVTG